MQIMSLTEAAAARIREIMAGSDQPVKGVRVGVKNAGCAGMAYTMDYITAPMAGDDHVTAHGVDVWVEPKATLFLLGTVMDYEETLLSAGFTFNNPNQEGACGCGESVQLKPADLAEIAKARAEASAAH